MAVPVVHVHWIDLDAESLDLVQLEATLDPDETARAARIRFARDRRRYLARHGVLRRLLGEELGCAPQTLQFVSNSYGKPSLADSDLGFNLSHSHGMALFCHARGIALGCDIEQRDPRFASEKIPERYFSAAEVAALRSLAPELQTEAFFNCWTRKEAYVKARGFGLSLPLDGFEVSLAPGDAPALLMNCDGWTIQCFNPTPTHHAAVVAEGADWRMSLHPPPAPGGGIASAA